MRYTQSMQQFAAAMSKCVRHAESTSVSDGALQFFVVDGDVGQFFLKASEDAFEEIPSDVLISILTTKLRKDMRHVSDILGREHG